jgi:hypothetical protein
MQGMHLHVDVYCSNLCTLCMCPLAVIHADVHIVAYVCVLETGYVYRHACVVFIIFHSSVCAGLEGTVLLVVLMSGFERSGA